MKQFQTMIVLLLALAFLESSFGSGMEFEDIVIPDTCDVLANVNDHVLFSFRATFENNTAGPEISPTSQPYYTLLDATSLEGLGAGIKGMCENSTRRLKFEDISADANKGKLSPVITPSSGIYELEEEFTFEIHLHKVTSQDDYQIFDAFRKDNISMVLDLIEQHKGINAMDEYGQTPMMIAVTKQYLPIVSALLNTRRPMVDVNQVKSSGYSALFYAVEKAPPGILQALLRRGADPNKSVRQAGSVGNTPLHFACLLEKVKHAQLLLDYGADPFAKNEHGVAPMAMMPRDAVPSIRMMYRQMFDEARARRALEEKERIKAGASAGAAIAGGGGGEGEL